VTATIAVGRRPFGVAITPDGRRAYVASHGVPSVSVIDTATNRVTATISTGPYPFAVDITPDGSRVYLTHSSFFTGQGSVSVISTATNTVTGTIAVAKPTALGKFITPPPPDPPNAILISPQEFPYRVTFEERCVESVARLCLRKEIVRVCVGGNCFTPPPTPPPPICVICAAGAGLAAGAAFGGVAALLLSRRKRP
jgi:YVTN family beta-propeller protein